MPYDVNIGDGADALGQNQLTDALGGTYWVSGWDATLGTGDLEVDIAAGSGAVDGTDVSTASTQTIDFTGDPDSTDPRKAVIYVDSGGTVQKALGTPQPVDPSGENRFRTYNPSPPASVSGVVVAEVWLAAGVTILESADIRDRRVGNQAASAATPNTPAWSEDDNSPQTETNSTNLVYNLSNSYDLVKIDVKVTEPSAIINLGVRVNGDSGSNYRQVLIDGTTETGQTEWGSLANEDIYTFILSGRWDGKATIGPATPRAGASVFVTAGENGNVTSPLSSIELFSTGGTSLDELAIRVYGRDI